MNKDEIKKIIERAIFKYEIKMALKAVNEEIKEWITVKGNHIPVMKGETKDEAIQSFIEEKSGGGYSSERNKSNRAIIAEVSGMDNISNLSKKLGIPSKELKTLYSDEWHHTNKNYTKTNYYHTQAYVDLKEKGEITQETIDKYDLNEYQIIGMKKSWELLQNKLKASSPQAILEEYKKTYNSPAWNEVFEEVLSRKKKVSFRSEEIRRAIEWYREEPTEENKAGIDRVIKYFDNIINK